MDQNHIVVAALSTVFGLFVLWGAHRRWSWLVDPPVKLWPFYSQAFLKKVFGAKAVVYYTYVIGFAFLVFAAMTLLALD